MNLQVVGLLVFLLALAFALNLYLPSSFPQRQFRYRLIQSAIVLLLAWILLALVQG